MPGCEEANKFDKEGFPTEVFVRDLGAMVELEPEPPSGGEKVGAEEEMEALRPGDLDDVTGLQGFRRG